MKRLIHWTQLLAENLIMVLVLVLVTLTIVQVFFRYVISNPLSWSEEVTRYCLIWIVLLGTGLGLNHQGHLGFDSLVCLLPRRSRKMAILFKYILIAVAAFFLLIVGTMYALKARGTTSPAVGMSNVFVFAALPISAATWLIFIAGQMADVIMDRNQGEK